MSALQILATQDYAYSEAFGVKGLAELILRNLLASGETFLDVAYSPANAAKLRKAAEKIRESTEGAATFSFTKEGNEYREVTYAVTRNNKSHSITRQFLITEAIRCTSVQNEADNAA
jgi:hypothetical protein